MDRESCTFGGNWVDWRPLLLTRVLVESRVCFCWRASGNQNQLESGLSRRDRPTPIIFLFCWKKFLSKWAKWKGGEETPSFRPPQETQRNIVYLYNFHFTNVFLWTCERGTWTPISSFLPKEKGEGVGMSKGGMRKYPKLEGEKKIKETQRKKAVGCDGPKLCTSKKMKTTWPPLGGGWERDAIYRTKLQKIHWWFFYPEHERTPEVKKRQSCFSWVSGR